ncbi:class II aldolase/adducin family protein|uniref:L-fuculose-phosphate aldolase n=1 Tax=Dendrosporobacter quercicolus TaxID=146817 RepID=A0A1G9LZX3_9FIRM|nr:class II aldolase/adducin family protein [Dendrosporobacter quercicolus]NSL46870.1 class II aldolase/adducin family protein [Dendrosporobacter quercicolus DSM 1736]SDL67538.1 L-fuculose-phosphate aldolase [Dendrosporobacter quercicolus]
MDWEKQIKTQLINYGCALLDCGLIAGTWGNLSARVPGGNCIAVTPSGRNYRSLTCEDIVLVNMEAAVVRGRLKPTSELALHLAIYRQRQEVKAIIHTHSVFASAFAVARRPIEPIVEDIAQLVGGSIEVAAYALNGTDELAENAVKALGGKNAVLLANHGLVCCGRTLSEAMLTCQLVEKTAQIFIYANQIGTAEVLSDGDIGAMHRGYVEDYSKRQGGQADD